MNQARRNCPICGLEEPFFSQKETQDYNHILLINCKRCGVFEISKTSYPKDELRTKLSAWIREKYSKNPEKVIQINNKNIKRIESNLPDYSPLEKQDILLHHIENKTSYPGDIVSLDPNFDYPLAWANNKEELLYYNSSLKERHLIKSKNDHPNQTWRFFITSEGWTYLEKIKKENKDSKQVFVAMSFSDSMDTAWTDAIKPAISEAGYNPLRIDKEPHNDRIDIKIMSEIKNSKFLVVDVTEQKQGVYFEAGYALGLGIPVIWTVKKDDLEKTHFDTRQYNHICWNKLEELKDDLINFINVIINNDE